MKGRNILGLSLILVLSLLLLSLSREKQQIEIKPTSEMLRIELKRYSVFDIVGKYSKMYTIDSLFIIEVGDNESGWEQPRNPDWITFCTIPGEGSLGDLQIYPSTRKYYFKKLNLDTVTRENLINASVAYMSDLHHRYKGDYYKMRYAYGRGRFKHPSKWTRLEREFMSTSNWSKFNK